MKKLAFISDLLFTFLTSFLFTACFFRFLRLNLFTALTLSAVCGALTTCAIAALLHARRKKSFLKKSDAENKDKLLLHLALCSDEQVTHYFLDYFAKTAKAARTEHTAAKPDDNRIETEDKPPVRRGKLRIDTQDGYYALHFKIAPVTPDDVAALFRIRTNKPKILLCSAIDSQAAALCAQLNITYRTGEQVYAALKQADALPKRYLGSEKKPKRKRKLRLWFSKANARRYLSSAAMILLIAYLTPFFYYYLVFGAALLLVAVFVRIFGYDTHATAQA